MAKKKAKAAKKKVIIKAKKVVKKKAVSAPKAKKPTPKKTASKKVTPKKKAVSAPKAKKTTPKKKTAAPKKSSVKKAKSKPVAKAKADAAAKAKADAVAKTKEKVKAAPAPKADGGHTKVLSVDDEEVIRSLLKKVLTKAGYEVALASSGEEGLKIMKNEHFDIAIIDLKMPGMGGMAFLEKMKGLYPDTEAVILTGFGDIDIAVDAMKKGAFNFVPKPFKNDTFLTIVSMALERRVMKRDMEEAKATIREIENSTSQRIGELEGQLIAVGHAKKELGDQFNAIKKSLIDGTGNQADLERKVMSLEKVAQQIKSMEEVVIASESKKKGTLKKVKDLEKELSSKVSRNIALGNKLDEAKSSLNDLKKKAGKEATPAQKAETATEVSLTDIHQALADFRKETED